MDRKEYLKQYRCLNRDKAKKYQKAWRKLHPVYDSNLQKRRRKENPDSFKRIRRRVTLKQYGLTLDLFNSLLMSQGNRCKICSTTKPGGFANQWAVDHDHISGRVRGLLCNNCNKGLGHFKDSMVLLDIAIRYLANV